MNKKLLSTITVLILVLLISSLTVAARGFQEEEQEFKPIPAYDATGAMLKAVVFPRYPERRSGIVRAYDATGAMISAVVLPHEAQPAAFSPVYDATGVMLAAVVLPHEAQPAAFRPVYDATATMLSAIVQPLYGDNVQVSVSTR